MDTNKKPLYIVLVLLSIFFSQICCAQNSINVDAYNNPPMDETITPTLTFQELYLSFGILGFGVITLIIFVISVNKKNIVFDKSVYKYLILILIIVSSLFLVTAGYGNEQISPIIGLLGTIVGYLIGGQQNGGQQNGGQQNGGQQNGGQQNGGQQSNSSDENT